MVDRNVTENCGVYVVGVMMDKKREVKKLFNLCIEINGLKETMGTNRTTVFFEYAGHVNHADVRVYEGGWDANKNPVRLTVDLDHPYRTPDKFYYGIGYRTITEVIEYLEGLK